jgi:PhnB protein
MSLSIHLNFNGQCQQAFEFYVTVLQGEIDSMLQVKDAPISESFSADWQQKIVHASISIQDVLICGADVKPEYYQKPSGFYLLLGFGNEAAVICAFQQLSAGGTVILPPQQTFWSSCYAIVIDRFGVPWKLNCSASGA